MSAELKSFVRAHYTLLDLYHFPPISILNIYHFFRLDVLYENHHRFWPISNDFHFKKYEKNWRFSNCVQF